ncbi:MAG TPA: adhesin [Actinoplanes sp.]|nr:adhesin [Actinoplanes sp.]
MRSTVGPLPPAVYWRRRALVLGVLLLVVIALFVACGGEDNGNQGGGTGASSSQAPAPAPAGSTPEDEPSFSDAQPGAGPSLPAPEDLVSPQPGADGQPGGNGQSTTGANATGTNANVIAPADGSCADQEISVTPVPAVTTAKRGTPMVIRLKIKNIGTRSCTRDLGAGAQELYMDQGARKYWSSDTCSADRRSNPQQMRPGAEYEYTVTWNGRQSSKCTAALPAGPAPPPGTYEIRGRLGTKVSQPVALTIAG